MRNEKVIQDEICVAPSWTHKYAENLFQGCCLFFIWFFFNNKREVNQKQFDHIHATSHPHTPFNVFQKWCYSADAELKRDHLIVTELIHSITLNNALKALQLAVVYIRQKYT